MSAPTAQTMYENDIQAPSQYNAPVYKREEDSLLVKPGYSNSDSHHDYHGLPPAGGICDLNCDWGNNGATGKAGACSDCFQCEPCCGDPCNIKDGLYCICCYAFCSLCIQAKMLSYSLDQDCACVNHCGPICGAYLFATVVTVLLDVAAIFFAPIGCLAILSSCSIFAMFALVRRNLRGKFRIGSPDSWLGDFFMMCCSCTLPCSLCQEYRSMPISGWDWLGDIRLRGWQCYEADNCCDIVRKY